MNTNNNSNNSNLKDSATMEKNNSTQIKDFVKNNKIHFEFAINVCINNKNTIVYVHHFGRIESIFMQFETNDIPIISNKFINLLNDIRDEWCFDEDDSYIVELYNSNFEKVEDIDNFVDSYNINLPYYYKTMIEESKEAYDTGKIVSRYDDQEIKYTNDILGILYWMKDNANKDPVFPNKASE